MSAVAPGTSAPAFSLASYGGEKFTNADLAGRTTVLVFYPFAFSEVCTDQFQIYNEVLDELAEKGATVYGVSCDATQSQEAFRRSMNVDVAMLSDFEPKGAVCEAFGVLHPGGFPQRALVIIGPDGEIKWRYVAPSPGDLPGVNVIFDGLEHV